MSCSQSLLLRKALTTALTKALTLMMSKSLLPFYRFGLAATV